MSTPQRLGTKVRALRRREGLSQAAMARRLGISASYLNLIERDKRPLTAPVLIKIAGEFSVDVASFADAGDTALASELMEVFSDPVFETSTLMAADVREAAEEHPAVARAVVTLYRAFGAMRESNEQLAARVDGPALASAGFPSEEVNDAIQAHNNCFAVLEDAAERVRAEAVVHHNLAGALVRWLEQRGVRVEIREKGVMGRAVRRFDPVVRVLRLSEILPPRSREKRRIRHDHRTGEVVGERHP
jgi:transcriptional regulator with XRE-family HTH domain